MTPFPKRKTPVENQRNFILAIALSVLVLVGWSAISAVWFPVPKAPPAKSAPASGTAPGTTSAPVQASGTVPTVAPAVAIQDRTKVLAGSSRVAIRTPSLEGSINLTGARIDDLVLVRHRTAIDKGAPPVRLLSPAGTANAYYAAFGWIKDGFDTPNAATQWTADSSELTPQRPVTLSTRNNTGQTFSIRFAVDDNYLFTIEQTVGNGGPSPISARGFAGIQREAKSTDLDQWTAHVGPVSALNGRANYDVDYDYVAGKPIGFWGTLFGTRAVSGVNMEKSTGGWLGFGDHYWLTALSLPKGVESEAAFSSVAPGGFKADVKPSPQIVKPGSMLRSSFNFFAGAKEVALLDNYEAKANIPLFGKAIDWGWFEIVEKPIFYYLDWLFKLFHNFGVAIILLTFTVRLLMFPIAQRQFASMASMKVVQPKIKALQERYKDDKPRQQQELMALYKSEKINPLGGCLPALIQIPVFFALYKVLILTIEMRHQPFVLWIKDLSARDPFFFGLFPDLAVPAFLAIGALPIIVGITQYVQFKLNPQPMDETQAQVFKIMPFMLIFVMASFASGLQIYWMTTNILTIGQQWLLYRKHPSLKAAPAAPTAT